MNRFIFPFSEECLKFTTSLISHPLSQLFRKPYKPVDSTDDYFEIVKNPMDLSTIKSKLTKNEYSSLQKWENDMNLIFENAILYNGENHLLGCISLFYKKKLKKFLSNLENNNPRNFEKTTKNLYNVVLSLVREIPDEAGIKYDYEPPVDRGDFNKERFVKIKNGLNRLCIDGKAAEVLKLIHNTDQEFRTVDVKEIDVAKLSRATLLAIEDFIGENEK
ncbi:Bromodomain containing protein [Tritrichomonas foetus]|uniref:Bromodomain containing protein n=1 Tax=Tritrichomonas foetus TaxID=1144522 RepID=A0A1J4K0N7_9EUKA|nr:Bromodomain containing protein [Tritrichomonas foetus]|eukprot:OHT04811.1 Bromodomain containing protein [Tritrichomonas foetus]